MKRKLHLIITTSAASVLAFSVLAQDPPHANRDQTRYIRDRAPDAPAPARLNEAAKVSDLIGMTVKNHQDERLGTVEDIAVDMESGRIVQVIISTGAFIGIGDSLTAVPPGALHHDVPHKVLHLDADKAKLQSAPKFETSNWAECCNSNHLSEVYGHFGQKPAFTFINNGEANLDGTTPEPGQIAHPTRRVDLRDQNRGYAARQGTIPTSRLSQTQKATKLLGMPVNNLQEEKVGKLQNLLVDLPSGRIVAVILSSGGFLGLSDELSVVPPAAFRFAPDRETLLFDASKETLASRPHFQANHWADLSQTSYTAGVYRAYGIEPYFENEVERYASTSTDKAQGNTPGTVSDLKYRTVTVDQGNIQANADRPAGTQASEPARRNVRERIDSPAGVDRDAGTERYSNTNVNQAPDNTARNVRDRNDQALTPLNQGNSQADVDTTAQIRKEVIAGKNMSVNAKNVKIITNKGQVTLRGPVNTAEEKELIGEIANRIARSENVDNQLEVKLTSTTSSNN